MNGEVSQFYGGSESVCGTRVTGCCWSQYDGLN